MIEYIVSGTRESSGNEFTAPVHAEDEDSALIQFKQSVDDPEDFSVSDVEQRLQ